MLCVVGLCNVFIVGLFGTSVFVGAYDLLFWYFLRDLFCLLFG